VGVALAAGNAQNYGGVGGVSGGGGGGGGGRRAAVGIGAGIGAGGLVIPSIDYHGHDSDYKQSLKLAAKARYDHLSNQGGSSGPHG